MNHFLKYVVLFYACLIAGIAAVGFLLPGKKAEEPFNETSEEKAMKRRPAKMITRDKRTIMQKVHAFLTDRKRARLQLQRAPRTLAEALRDSGALAMPPRKRLTGGWA